MLQKQANTSSKRPEFATGRIYSASEFAALATEYVSQWVMG